MTRPHRLIFLFLAILPLSAWGQNDDLAKVKEQELEEVRERISELKQSMDKSAGSRDRITSELQDAEVEMAEKRQRLKELEREREFSTRKKQELDAQIVTREAQLCGRNRGACRASAGRAHEWRPGTHQVAAKPT